MQPIVEDVRQKGDAAVKSYTKRFDKVDLDTVCVPIEVRQPVKNALCTMAACMLYVSPWHVTCLTQACASQIVETSRIAHPMPVHELLRTCQSCIMWRATSEVFVECLSGLQSIPDPELSRESREAFDVAYKNIRRFHEAQQSQPLEVETMPGVKCRRVTRPIGK